MKHRSICLALASLYFLTARPALSQRDVTNFDILGIRLHSTSPEVMAALNQGKATKITTTKRPCADALMTFASAGRSADPRTPGNCESRIEAVIDSVTTIDISLIEDFPNRPGITIVGEVGVRYRYGEKAKPPLHADMRKALVAKYGEPRYESSGNLIIEWGAATCAGRVQNCPPREAYLRYDGDELRLSNESLTATRKRAIEKAVYDARPRASPKF